MLTIADILRYELELEEAEIARVMTEMFCDREDVSVQSAKDKEQK